MVDERKIYKNRISSFMKQLIFLSLITFSFIPFILSCSFRADIEKDSKLPVCLVVTNKSKIKQVQQVIIEWNDRLENPYAFTLFPNCLAEENREIVPVLFTKQKPEQCEKKTSGLEPNGCVITRKVGQEILFIEVLIWEKAPNRTLLHELGHLAGCSHDDFLPPCWE